MAFAILYLTFLGLIAPYFFDIIQHREGYYPSDPILDLLPSKDLSIVIFDILYALIGLSMVYFSLQPMRLLQGTLAYSLLITLRFTTMFLVPFEPPLELIELQDTLVFTYFYGQVVITKDLFFSGHAATLWLLFFLTENRAIRISLLGGAIVVTILILIQHAHYTWDVLAAPLFAYAAYKLSGWILKRFSDGNV